jgi:hypothetical protein
LPTCIALALAFAHANVSQGDVITPVSVSSNSEYASTQSLISGTYCVMPYDGWTFANVSTWYCPPVVNGEGMSLSEPGKLPTYTFTLPSTLSINRAYLWNHNQCGIADNDGQYYDLTNRGVKTFDILTSRSGVNYTSVSGGVGFQLAETPADSIAPTQTVSFATRTAHYVRIVVRSNWGSEYTGLSEVRFGNGASMANLVAPEPCSMVLLAVAMICLVCCSRKTIARNVCLVKAGTASLAIAVVFIGVARANADASSGDSLLYLNSGSVKVGVDLDMGGSITFLSSPTGPNFVNNYDLGRQIQQGYYAGPFPFRPDGVQAGWDAPWNPIQSGDAYRNRSKVLEYSTDGSVIYTKCQPMVWHLNNYPGDCTIEQWTSVQGNVVTVRNRLNNARIDTTPYPYEGYGTEAPAVYLNTQLMHMVTYDGTRPFTGGNLTTRSQGQAANITDFRATENWAAWVNDVGWGVGVVMPGCNDFDSTYSGPVGGWSGDYPFSYLCPALRDILDHNISYEFTYQLVLGNVEDIRNQAYAVKVDSRPNFQFAADRQHWYYVNASDTGWPITGKMHVKLDQNDPQMISPFTSFRAEDVPKISICAAFNLDDSTSTVARLFWQTNNEGDWNEAESYSFDVINDGKYHTYEINLASNPNYAGLISWLRFDPTLAGHAGDFMDIRYISYVPEPSCLVMFAAMGLIGIVAHKWHFGKWSPARRIRSAT